MSDAKRLGCRGCWYFDPGSEFSEVSGWCRRHPPHKRDGDKWGSWEQPAIDDADTMWCGEWRQNEEAS